MKIKIDVGGYLHLERKCEMKQQLCPQSDNDAICGDWCPLFGEPYADADAGGQGFYNLSLCNTTLACYIQDFTDERKKGE